MIKCKEDLCPKKEYGDMRFWLKSKGSFVREEGSREKSEALTL